ncbi:MAG: hypothetical protein KC635_08265, partial [Myxococcales bacterium]|nr:hypothetical protein [Myxococcales bacterium]
CDDGDACTREDRCSGTACTGLPVTCDDHNPCTADACDPTVGCVAPAVPAGTACDDHRSCTLDDVCDGAVCHGTQLACDDGNPCTVDGCDEDVGCFTTPAPFGSACDDGDACTTGELCFGGECVGAAVTCDDGNGCTTDRCEPATGCVTEARVGAPCDDGSACTGGDACDDAGACVGAAVSCDDADPCTIDRCDPAAGCVTTPAAAGTACDDGDPCTIGEACGDGGCVGGAARECDDGNPCTANVCVPGTGCVATLVPNATPCTDGDACTVDDVCAGGVCRGAAAVCDDGDPCTVDACDAELGCVTAPAGDGTACDDGDACTVGDGCAAGACAGGAAVDCDDGNPCTLDGCDAGVGCLHQPVTGDVACDDGDACTTDDTCDVGFCVAQGFADEGASCEDGLFCTGADTCDGAGSCRPGADPCARPASSCLVGSCDEIGGTCLSGPKDADAPCSDGNGCTLGDHCSGAGVCLPGSDVDCGSESDECNAGTCRSLGPNDHVCDLSPRSAGVACTNPDFCIVGSQCDGEGGCVGGTARDCQAEAGDQCNSATCNTLQAKCVRTPRPQNSTCDDGDDCTLTDRCSNGACVGAENACVAEQLSYVDGGGRRPSVLSMGFGRYVTLWAKNTTDPDVFWRLSDARGGRESDEVEVNSPGRPLEWTTGLATRPGGDFIVGYWYGVTTVNTTYTGACSSPQAKTASASVSARAYDYIGTLYNTSVAQQALLTAELKVYSCESVNNRMDVTAGRMYPVPGAAGFGFVISAEATRTGNLVEMMSLSVPDRNVLLYPATALVGVGAPVVLQDDAGEDRVATGLPLVVKLANDGSGDFFAAWVAFGGDHAVVRRYSANGARRHDGANLLSLAAPAGGSLVGVRLAPRHDGGLYVALDAQTATTGRDALLRRFDAAGAAADGGVATQLHAASAGDQRLGEIDVFSDDGLAATWDDSLGDTSGYGVKARLFNADGAPRGPETLVNTLIAGTQELPTLAVLDTDEWVVAFVDDQETVYTRRYLANGKSAVGALDWRLNSTTTGNQKNVAAARTADGRVLAVYETPVAGQSKAKIVGRFVTVAGARPTIAPEVTLNAGSDGLLSWPDVAAGAASIAAVWQATGVDGNGEGVVARMFDQAGTPVSGDFVVNQWATGTQSVPSVAVVPDGRAVVAWQGPKPGGGGGTYAIYRVFAADGTPLTDEALVDEDLTNYRAPQVVAVGSDVVIAYTDYNNTGAIYLRRLSLEGDVLASWHSTSGRRGVVAALSGDGSVLTSCFERTVGTGAYSVGCSAHDPATLAQIGDDSAVTDRWPGARMVTEIGRSLRMAPLEGGRTVVGWQMDSFYVDGAGVKATALDEVGALSGPDIVATRQLLGEQSHPEVVWLGGTNAVVFWEDDSRDGSNTGVYFRVLTEL